MCELFAMNARFPTNVNFSLEEFSRHGGVTDHHQHGWGLAYFDGNDARLIRETEAAGESRHLSFMRQHNYRSKLVLSHIRYATQGKINLSNTQPFSREWRGKRLVFAHNGDLKGFEAELGQRYLPIGETDSETSFCYLLKTIDQSDGSLADEVVQGAIHQLARSLEPYGPFNFLLGDGDVLIAHGHKRTQVSGKMEPPGLYFLCRRCSIQKDQCTDISGLALQMDQEQEVILVASVPLSREEWKPFSEGETKVFQGGLLIRSFDS